VTNISEVQDIQRSAAQGDEVAVVAYVSVLGRHHTAGQGKDRPGCSLC
jgi:hypothetical protein